MIQSGICRPVLPALQAALPAANAENGVSDHEESGAAENRVRPAFPVQPENSASEPEIGGI